MSLQVGLVGCRIVVEAGCLDDILQHAAYVTVYVGHVEFATLHTSNDFLHLCRLSGLHEVVASLHLGNGGQALANTNPVGHHNTLVAPVFTQDFCQEVVVTHRKLAIDLVIRSHDGPRVTLAHGNLEAAQIEFAGSTLADTLIDAGTVGLLRVDGKVLGRHARTLALYAIDVGSGYLSCQQRILRVIFKVTATQRIAVQVHARSEDDVTTVFLGFVANGLTHLSDQFRVPRRCQTGTDGESSGIVRLAVALTGGVDAHTGRAVGEHGGRNAQAGYFWRRTGSTSHEVGLAAHHSCRTEELVGTTNQKFGFLFQCHGLQHLVDVVSTEFSLRCHCHCC